MEYLRIVKSDSKHFIADEVKFLAIDPEYLQEMGESILYKPDRTFIFAYKSECMVGFIAYDYSTILYAYTVPAERGKGVFRSLFNELPNTNFKVVASNASLPIFLKLGFRVVKNYKTCHKLIRY